MVIHACDPSTWKVGENEDQEFKVILDFPAHSRPAWAIVRYCLNKQTDHKLPLQIKGCYTGIQKSATQRAPVYRN